jgi:hypothetical protein
LLEELEEPGKGFWEEFGFILDEADLFLEKRQSQQEQSFINILPPNVKSCKQHHAAGKSQKTLLPHSRTFYTVTHNQSQTNGDVLSLLVRFERTRMSRKKSTGLKLALVELRRFLIVFGTKGTLDVHKRAGPPLNTKPPACD